MSLTAPEWLTTWFTSKFDVAVPEAFAHYRAKHPNGLWSQAGSLWNPMRSSMQQKSVVCTLKPSA